MTLDEIDARISELEMQDPSPIEAFRRIAYNMCVESEGRFSFVEPLSFNEKFAKIFA